MIYEQAFKHIKTFNSVDQIYEFNKLSFNLSQNI